MITLTFETWEEFDDAISGIVSVATAIATPSEQQKNFFRIRRVDLTNDLKSGRPCG